MRIIKQSELFHLYLVDDKDVWLTTNEMKRLFRMIGKNLGVENGVIKDGNMYVFAEDEEGADECLRCALANVCDSSNNPFCRDCFGESVIGKRFKPL